MRHTRKKFLIYNTKIIVLQNKQAAVAFGIIWQQGFSRQLITRVLRIRLGFCLASSAPITTAFVRPQMQAACKRPEKQPC
jgi:hypothetical protein